MTAAELLRDDLQLVSGLVTPGCRVLDLGCGNGGLLAHLRDDRQCRIQGVESSLEDIAACIARGVPVIQTDLDRGLRGIPDGAFDVVVLSQTLQVVRDSRKLLEEIMRVGRRAVVSYANFAHISARSRLGLRGRMPVSEVLPYSWYDSPNIHFTTLTDFRALCAELGYAIEEEIPLLVRETRADRIRVAPNLRANLVIAAIARR